MPASRPRASFEPIPPDFDVRTFVETADNFQYVDRISLEMIAEQGIEQFEKLVLLHVIIGGKPLVIDGFEEVLDPWTFTPSWLRDNHGEKVENARNLTTKDNIPLTIKHYLKHLSKLTDQFFDSPDRYRDKTRQRIYLKDIDCPPVWQDKVREKIPASLFYLNESTGDVGGPGATDRKSRGIGRAGDLMSSLPPEMRAENLMCYIGHEGTYTPAHREMCASLGQNIMVDASSHIGEDGKPEHPGSSLWFMTETKDRQVVAEYWLSILGHDIEVENHFAQLIAWKKAPFSVYVVEQRPGDFILIPPLAPHQVWNRGTRTMKVAWNRTTVETLELAMSEALPNARMVCRDEQYKNKGIIYYTLLKYSNLLRMARAQAEMGGEQAEAIQRSSKVRQVNKDFKRLFDLYKTTLLSEMYAPDSREHPEFVPYDGNITCAYCRCNIFNRFLTCKSCAFALGTETEEPYDICMDCYSMGRSCACQSGYKWVEQFKWKDLLHKYEEWRAQIIDIDGQVTEKTPLPLMEERRYFGKKTLAQVCQEQLKIRPFIDITKDKPVEDDSEDEEIVVNDDGTVKKTVKKRSKAWLNDHKSCHFCLHRHPKWKMAFCTNCDFAYCYGTLFRAHDMMPLGIMEDPRWTCPHCRRVCNTGACRRDPRQKPYEPKGTLLGHDTKKVADVRSVEALVDFSVSNLNWLRDDVENGHDSVRLQQRRQEAEKQKRLDPAHDARYVDEGDTAHGRTVRNGIEYSPVEDENDVSRVHEGLIDPALGGTGAYANEDSYMEQESTLHQGYVEPSSVMYGYQPDDNEDSFYPDPDGEIPRLGGMNKRAREDDEEIRRDGKSKKRKKDKKDKNEEAAQPAPPKNTSSKQFQKEKERRLLEEARKAGQYIMVAARMKKKSKVAKLSISSDRLAAFQAEQAYQPAPAPRHGMDGAAESRSILQSDILPTNGARPTGAKPKGPTSFRYRIEDDETFGSRTRHKKADEANATAKTKPKRRRYEEFTIESDEEEFQEEDDDEYTGTRSQPRASNWLARKHQDDDEDMPTELPPNFRDGMVNPRSEQEKQKERERRERRKTMPAKPSKAQIRPRGRPPRKSTGNISDEDGIHEEDDTASLMLAQSAAAALEATRKAEEEEARAKAAEDNLRAKMMISNEWDGSDHESVDAFIDSLAAEPTIPAKEPTPQPPPTRSGPPQTSNSIFSRPGMAGRKIKIVSAKRTATPSSMDPSPAPATTGFQPINAVANGVTKKIRVTERVVQLSDSSDSEDEIPAKIIQPPAKKPGRPSIPSRGRGRPRKSM